MKSIKEYKFAIIILLIIGITVVITDHYKDHLNKIDDNVIKITQSTGNNADTTYILPSLKDENIDDYTKSAITDGIQQAAYTEVTRLSTLIFSQKEYQRNNSLSLEELNQSNLMIHQLTLQIDDIVKTYKLNEEVDENN